VLFILEQTAPRHRAELPEEAEPAEQLPASNPGSPEPRELGRPAISEVIQEAASDTRGKPLAGGWEFAGEDADDDRKDEV